VPGVAVEASDHNIGRNGTDAECFTGKLDAERMADEAPSPVRANQWSEEDFSTLVRLLRRFVDDVMGAS
jgi:hypothetical protein